MTVINLKRSLFDTITSLKQKNQSDCDKIKNLEQLKVLIQLVKLIRKSDDMYASLSFLEGGFSDKWVKVFSFLDNEELDMRLYSADIRIEYHRSCIETRRHVILSLRDMMREC